MFPQDYRLKESAEGLPVCRLNFHRLINFFCIVEYTVLIFYMATINGLWEYILINSPGEYWFPKMREILTYISFKFGIAFMDAECWYLDFKISSVTQP